MVPVRYGQTYTVELSCDSYINIPSSQSYISYHGVFPIGSVTLHTPTYKPLFSTQGLLTLVFVVAGDIASLIDFASFLIWTFYCLAMLALLVMRKTKQDAARPYKVSAIVSLVLLNTHSKLHVHNKAVYCEDPAVRLNTRTDEVNFFQFT
jgi:hypothetical protein